MGMRFHMSMAGVIGVAAFVLGLLKDRKLHSLTRLSFFSSTPNREEKLFLLPGLQNLGNNCFLNVILQALASCSNFQPFLQNAIEESELFVNGVWSGSLQLTVALAALLEELSVFGERRKILSPREVMLAMADSVQNFSLTSQQDAEEAFLHLLSSLREEFSDSYMPNQCSLADALSPYNFRILALERQEITNEQERWQQRFLGPFNGVLSSTLTCQTCSSQISANFQFFHSLPLLPVLENGGTIMTGCTLEDCLKQFTTSDQVENYNCSNCWHIAAMKLLSLQGKKGTEIEALRTCTMQDSCTCHSLPDLQRLPWSNNFSCTLKQLTLARCPKILCIHLQRASVNHFGELVKIQGHVRFPMILDMLPFTLDKVQCQKPSPLLDLFNVQYDPRKLTSVFGQSVFKVNEHMETLAGKSNTTAHSNALETEMSSEVNDEGGAECLVYRLVAAVEHFGRVGGGHYTVYRRVTSQTRDLHPSWFCISDSVVNPVTEEDVLAANATLLFYERIE